MQVNFLESVMVCHGAKIGTPSTYTSQRTCQFLLPFVRLLFLISVYQVSEQQPIIVWFATCES